MSSSGPPLCFFQGQFLPFDQACLTFADAGFVFGATVVDNARTFRQRLFRWQDHLARFRRDCLACFVPLEIDEEQLTAAAHELVAQNLKLLPSGSELHLVTFATPGALGFYGGSTENGPPMLGMITYPVPARSSRLVQEGAVLAVVGSQGTVAEAIVPPTIKHRSRMHWYVADQKARGVHPQALALLMDCPRTSGTLTETSIANFLVVKEGQVLSPPRGLILDGVSLRVTEELCQRLGIPFVEQTIGIKDMAQVSEALLTGTGFCIAGVRELYLSDSSSQSLQSLHSLHSLPFDWPGPVFQRLREAWSELVGVPIQGQESVGPGVRSQSDRSQESGVRSQESGVRSQSDRSQ